MTQEGDLLWTPPPERYERSNLRSYLRWLERERGLRFDAYHDLWSWSVTELEAFWSSIAGYFGVAFHAPYERVLAERTIEGARWFPGATLNYAEHALRRRDDHVAVVAAAEDRPPATTTYAELWRETAEVAVGLRGLGVGVGDRVAAFLPNTAETLVAFLATASVGAVWSSCPPEFGVPAVVDRFRQFEPKLLLTTDGYRYGGKAFASLEAAAEIVRQLPTVERVIVIPNLAADVATGRSPLPGAVAWQDLHRPADGLAFEPAPFDHPLWVLYTSGTTGAPKAIVQGHGGILLEHYKSLALHLDLKPEDRFFWFSTTGWMMWNYLVSGLLLGCTVVLYDGSPAYPNAGALWRLAAGAGITFFGTSAPFVQACANAGVEPGRDFDLHALHSVGSTASPLTPDLFAWIYDHLKRDVLVGSASGGTDTCTAFLGPAPGMPVHAGELQCRTLGAKAEVFDGAGRAVVGEVGELVLTEPLPSMPLRLLNDPDARRYHESYFADYPGVWRHGDWMKLTERGSAVLYGRSDATLNRNGVRMGTSDFYQVVESLPEIEDSLVVDTSGAGPEGKLLLFVVLPDGVVLDDALRARINGALRCNLSPRHQADAIHAVPEIPRTLNGKKVEVPIKRLLAGAPAERVISLDALRNPAAIEPFVWMAKGQSWASW